MPWWYAWLLVVVVVSLINNDTIVVVVVEVLSQFWLREAYRYGPAIRASLLERNVVTIVWCCYSVGFNLAAVGSPSPLSKYWRAARQRQRQRQ